MNTDQKFNMRQQRERRLHGRGILGKGMGRKAQSWDLTTDCPDAHGFGI
jgi:hypothetical protein